MRGQSKTQMVAFRLTPDSVLDTRFCLAGHVTRVHYRCRRLFPPPIASLLLSRFRSGKVSNFSWKRLGLGRNWT